MRALALAMATAASVALAPGAAAAEKMSLEVRVVEASVKGNTTSPELAHMRADFQAHGFAYRSYRLVSEKTLSVEMKSTAEIALPNGKVARFTPEKREKSGAYSIHLEIPTLFDVRYTIGNGGTFFQGAGANDHGKPDESQVILMVKHTSG